MKDLLLVLADKNANAILTEFLSRPKALGIRAISFETMVHPGRDGGVRRDGVALARTRQSEFGHFAVIFDHEGCGSTEDPNSMSQALESTLISSVSGRPGMVLVPSPEIDKWVWGSTSGIATASDWKRDVSVREFVQSQGFELDQRGKPVRPKEAMQAVLSAAGKPRSSSNYAKIAKVIGLANCVDPDFKRFRSRLQEWFPS